MQTGRCVREAAEGGYVVTERGMPVAMLVPLPPNRGGGALPDREALIRQLPRIGRGSERLIRAERERR